MNDVEINDALEKVWQTWKGDITTDDGISDLESEMHAALMPNHRELNKLHHDIIINQFIEEKMKEFNEAHERSTFPNTYYGVTR